MAAIIKFVNTHYSEPECLRTLLLYAASPEKCLAIGGIGVSSDIVTCHQEMSAVKRYYRKEDGKQLAHIVVSSEKFNYMTTPEVYLIAKLIGQFYGLKYQMFFGIHRSHNQTARHIHFIVNSVSFVDGKKFHTEGFEKAIFAKYVSDVIGEPAYADIYNDLY